jgi:hypothetical protein
VHTLTYADVCCVHTLPGARITATVRRCSACVHTLTYADVCGRMQVRKDHRKCQEMLRMRQEEAATVVLLLCSACVYTLTYADVCRCGRRGRQRLCSCFQCAYVCRVYMLTYADVYVYVRLWWC